MWKAGAISLLTATLKVITSGCTFSPSSLPLRSIMSLLTISQSTWEKAKLRRFDYLTLEAKL